MLVQGLSERGIIIGLKSPKSLRILREDPASSSVLFPPLVPQTTTTPGASEPISTPEPPAPTLGHQIARTFVEAGKDNPTAAQLALAIAALNPHPDAPRLFVETLKDKIARVNHPGILPMLVKGFNARLMVLVKESAERPQPEKPPTLTPEGIAAYEAEEAERVAEAERARQEEAARCTGCKGTGKREHAGVKGVFKLCGLCYGTGVRAEFARPERVGIDTDTKDDSKERGG